MKSLAFCNRKGGSGKTTFTILFASYLAYRHKLNVKVIDFTSIIEMYRKCEIMNLEESDYEEAGKDLWEIIAPDKKFIKKIKELNLLGYSEWIKEEFKKEKYKNTDIVLYDTAVDNGDITEIILANCLGVCVIPLDSDCEMIREGLNTSRMIEYCRRHNPEIKTRTTGFINKINLYNDKKLYNEINSITKLSDIKLLPDMISFSERMYRIKGKSTLRTTLRYPDWEEPEFKGTKDLGLNNLFTDLLKILDSTEDIPGTSRTDLSFAQELSKRRDLQSLNRQINGTGFPDLETPLPEDMKNKFKKNR